MRLFDVAPTALANVGLELESALVALEREGLLGGALAADVLARVSTTNSLGDALQEAVHVQECAPESLDSKIALFKQLDAIADPHCSLASSTSALLPSSFSRNLEHRGRVLVAHPLNPPHLVPAVELVPAPWTTERTVDSVARLMKDCGQVPIRVRKEIPGFVMNRLQGALLHEAFRLVEGGFASVEDVDAAVRDGLGMRWSFMGPFETIDLNAPGGIVDFLERYGSAYEEIGRSQTLPITWRGGVAEKVVGSRRTSLPTSGIAARQRWRDEELARFAVFKRAPRTGAQ